MEEIGALENSAKLIADSPDWGNQPSSMRPAVLVVDDEPQILTAIGDVLEDSYEVLVTTSAEDGLRIVDTHPHLAVILSDQRMPGLTGDKFLAHARRRSSATRILITAYADLTAVVDAVNDGNIFAYVSKPWRAEELQLLITRAVEHCALQRQLQTERALLHNLLDNAVDAIYFKDANERFTRMNRAQAEMLGIDEVELAELDLPAIDLSSVVGPAGKLAIRTLMSDDAEVLETCQPSIDRVLELDNGEKRWYSTTKAPLVDTESRCHGLVSITRDITKHKHAQNLLAEREAALRLSTQLAGLGLRRLEKDLQGIRCWSSALLALLGISEQQAPLTIDEWLQRVHPADVDTVREALGRNAGETVDVLYRIRDGNDSWRYVREVIDGVGDVEASNDRLSTIQDVTERYQDVAQIRLLLQVTQAIEKAATLQDALFACLKCVSAHTDWEYGEAWVPDTDGETLVATAWFAGSDAYRELHKPAMVVQGQGLAGLVWSNKEPILLDEDTISTHVYQRRELLEKLRVKTALGIPILDDDEQVVAVFLFFPGAGVAIQEQSIAVASNVAQQLGASLKLRRTMQQLNESESRFRDVADNIPGVLCRFVESPKGDTVCTYMSSGAKSLFGEDADVSGMNLNRISRRIVAEDRKVFESFLSSKHIVGGHRRRIEFRVERDGAIQHVMAHAAARPTESGANEIHAVLIDITEQRRAEEHLEFLKNYDELTNLPNRKLLANMADSILKDAHGSCKLAVAIAVRIDQHGIVQETLGAEAGAEVLSVAAERLSSCIEQHDCLGRSGESEFLMVFGMLNDLDHVTATAKRVEDSIAGSLSIGSNRVHLSATLGVATFPDDASSAEELLGRAATACASAIADSTGVQYFRPDMNQRAIARLSLEQRIREALDQGEFTLHYQPQISLKTHRVTGLEALLRWPDGKRGFVSPAEFIPVAERSGLIVPIGEWVLDEVGRQVKEWGDPDILVPICVNVSAQQLRNGILFSLLQRLIDEKSVPPELIKIELTESGLIGDPRNIATLQSFRELGVGISVDDFGTGYSSLRYLRELPIDILKVDKSFIDEIVNDSKKAAIVNTIITLGHGLNMTVIAEGVENKDQLTYLRAYNCDCVQGFVFHKPVPASEIPAIVKNRLQK